MAQWRRGRQVLQICSGANPGMASSTLQPIVSNVRQRTGAQIEHPGLEWQVTAKISKPANPCPVEVPLQRFREDGQVVAQRQRRSGVIAGLNGKHHGRVSDVAAHRSLIAQLLDKNFACWTVRNTPLRRSKSDDVVEGGGNPQGAAHVAAVGDRNQAQCQGHGSTAAAAASGPGRIIGVARWPKYQSLGAQTEFGRVGLPDQDGAAFPDTLHSNGMVGRNIIREQG